MVTKTLTIMEDAYGLLLENKHENESFSDVVRRVLSGREKKRGLQDLFGMLSEDEGEGMLKDLSMMRKKQSALSRSRMERLYGKDS